MLILAPEMNKLINLSHIINSNSFVLKIVFFEHQICNLEIFSQTVNIMYNTNFELRNAIVYVLIFSPVVLGSHRIELREQRGQRASAHTLALYYLRSWLVLVETGHRARNQLKVFKIRMIVR